MAAPKTKALLLAQTEQERDALMTMLAGLSPEELLSPGAYGWSAKDHLAHLAEWERMLLAWYDAGVRGEKPAVPGEGYTWATLDALNKRIYEQHRDEPAAHVLADWRDTSRRLLVMTQAASESDLFTPHRYPWTGRGTLASFVYECGPNHYRWAATEIKRGLKVRR
ncbi:MAG: ClbS/DfsB family four-helix bundle protein [Candidatus Limnocylindrales bacterium]